MALRHKHIYRRVYRCFQYADIPPHIREGWKFDHVTEPRASCEQTLKIRNQLRAILPGTGRFVNGVLVKRHESRGYCDRYMVGDCKRLTLAEVEEMVMRRAA